MHHAPMPPSSCDTCGCGLDPDAYWLFIGSACPTPMCSECARMHTEGVYPIPFIIEAQLIIRDHQKSLASQVQL